MTDMENSKIRILMEEVLEALSGAIVVDDQARIVYLNKKYAQILNVDRNAVVGEPVEKIIPHTRMPLVLKTGKEEIGSIFELKNGGTIVCNRIPIHNDEKVIGAVSFTTFTKMDELTTFMRQIQRLNTEIDMYKKELSKLQGARYSFDQLIGESPVIQKLKTLAVKVAQTKSTVLISGETGTGKEFFSHAIHQLSPRNHRPFVRLNCAAIPKDLLESELFGYDEGAFTGAKKAGKPGKFELAHGGTLLLDEINELPLTLQSKLLRVIQEKEIDRVGGLHPIPVDVRLICTTNRILGSLVKQGLFREDLYYRINVVELNIPPLRERLEDLPALIEYCINRINSELGLSIDGVEDQVLKLFSAYHWPGNIRELDHALERVSNEILCGVLPIDNFDFLKKRMSSSLATNSSSESLSLEEIRANVEHVAIQKALLQAKGNKTIAAQILGIDRSVLYDKIRKYGVSS